MAHGPRYVCCERVAQAHGGGGSDQRAGRAAVGRSAPPAGPPGPRGCPRASPTSIVARVEPLHDVAVDGLEVPADGVVVPVEPRRPARPTVARSRRANGSQVSRSPRASASRAPAPMVMARSKSSPVDAPLRGLPDMSSLPCRIVDALERAGRRGGAGAHVVLSSLVRMQLPSESPCETRTQIPRNREYRGGRGRCIAMRCSRGLPRYQRRRTLVVGPGDARKSGSGPAPSGRSGTTRAAQASRPLEAVGTTAR